MDLQKKLLDLLLNRLPADVSRLRPDQVVFDRPSADRLFQADVKPPVFIKEHAKSRHIMPELCYVLKGEMALKWDERHYRLHQGDYCFIPRMLDHYESHSDPAVSYENLWIRFGTHPSLSVLHGGSEHYNYRIFNRMVINSDNSRLRLLPSLEQDSPFDLRTAVSELSTLYGLVGTALGKDDYLFIKRFEKEKNWRRRSLVKVREYIQEHLTEKLPVGKLASGLSMSSRYLGDLFKSEYGMTVVQYINGRRMDRALELLEETTLNISEIAETLNFRDIYYFSRLFKKHFGISPKDFRNKYL